MRDGHTMSEAYPELLAGLEPIPTCQFVRDEEYLGRVRLRGAG